MSDMRDQLAGIKILLQEQAEDCAQQAKYDQERRDATEKQRAETNAIESQIREKLQQMARRWEEEKIRQDKAPAETLDESSTDLLMDVIRQNHENQIEAVQTFMSNCSGFKAQQRAALLQETSRLQRKGRRAN